MLFYNTLVEYIEGQSKKIDDLRNSNIPERAHIMKVLAPSQNQNRTTNPTSYFVTNEVYFLEANNHGIIGDRHYMETRPSTGREKSLYPKGTKIREHRHIFAVSPYDCWVLSNLLEVRVTPEMLGANLLIGREDGKDFSLSALPENTHLIICERNSKEFVKPAVATLRHYTLQQGCPITGKAIAQRYQDDTLMQKFLSASKNHRGIVLSVEHPVEKPALIKTGQTVFFKFPTGITP